MLGCPLVKVRAALPGARHGEAPARLQRQHWHAFPSTLQLTLGSPARDQERMAAGLAARDAEVQLRLLVPLQVPGQFCGDCQL